VQLWPLALPLIVTIPVAELPSEAKVTSNVSAKVAGGPGRSGRSRRHFDVDVDLRS
jgi:hypothetical protein